MSGHITLWKASSPTAMANLKHGEERQHYFTNQRHRAFSLAPSEHVGHRGHRSIAPAHTRLPGLWSQGPLEVISWPGNVGVLSPPVQPTER